MERYAPIHPEHPLRRTAVALLVSLGVHAALLTALFLWALAVAAADRKAEAARPKEVALADIDAARWEANRRIVERAPTERAPAPAPQPARPAAPPPPRQQEPAKVPESAKVPERPAVAMIAPGREREPSAKGPAGASRDQEAPPPAPSPGPSPSGEDAARGPLEGTLDLAPRAQPIRPLAMRFDPVGPSGRGPVEEGTSFGGLTVQTPEAWRFTNFFGRAVEAMNSVYRYELGAPVPLELQTLILTRRAMERCSFTSVRLDRNGRVLEASVRRTSGIAELDQIIIEVIRKTAPFVNVPEGLADGAGVYSDTWGLCIGVRP